MQDASMATPLPCPGDIAGRIRAMKLLTFSSVAVALAVASVATPLAQAPAACNRGCLTGIVDTYIKALTANTPGAVALAPNAKITLNGKAVQLAAAIWDSADRTVYRWDIVNERLGDVATEAVIQNTDGSKTMYMVRLKVAS